jgi:glycosyltransferase involved in cell wall biosynthesis
MTKQDILTVIIPTRDRADTLKHTLRTVVEQKNPNLEILVSDNFSGPEVKTVVDAVSDPRLRYIRTPDRLGMAEHYDFAISNAKGDWVAIIGDDDALLPDAVDKFFAIHNKHPEIKAITCANCFYRWPIGDKKNKISIISGKGYEIRDSKEYTIKALTGKPVSQPTIYTGGFVHIDVINKAKSLSSNGRFFQSVNPDIYSGMAICALTDKYIYSWQAWTIAGISKHSTGFQHKNKTQEDLKKLDFHKENANEFHPCLGTATEACIGSPHIYLYEAFLKASHLRNNDDLGITLKQQLELFISHASGRTYKPVIEYAKKIAARNSLNFDEILKAANKKRAAYKLNKLARKVKKKIPGLSKLQNKTVNDQSVKTVYDASIRIGKEMHG